MVNYENGKIYKILDKTTGNIYIGSTAEKYLSRRLQRHIGHYKSYITNKKYYMTSFEILKNNNFEILLLETYPCNNKYELEQKERYYIENNTCVNKVIPTRTKKEYDIIYRQENKDKKKETDKLYRENNKEKVKQNKKKHYEENKEHFKQYHNEWYENNKQKVKEQVKQYRIDNKEKISEKNKEIVVCDLCGTQVKKYCLNNHKKTDKCKRLSVCMILD